MSRQGGLGRGLSALIPAAAPGQSGLIKLRLDHLHPNPRQPRERFDPEQLAELAHSLREHGMLQPIVARPAAGAFGHAEGDGHYEIVAGERRYRAAHLAGLDEVPVVVRHTEDAHLLTEALVENIHRADLDPLEEAAAFAQLLDDFGMTHDALAAKLGKSRSAISNSLRLLGLPESVQELVAVGALSAGHARTLLGLPDVQQIERTAQRVVAEGLSVRATEELVRNLLLAEDPPAALDDLAARARARSASPYLHVEGQLAEALGTTVRITGNAKRGKVVIDYAGAEDLERLLDIVGRGTGVDLLAG